MTTGAVRRAKLQSYHHQQLSTSTRNSQETSLVSTEKLLLHNHQGTTKQNKTKQQHVCMYDWSCTASFNHLSCNGTLEIIVTLLLLLLLITMTPTTTTTTAAARAPDTITSCAHGNTICLRPCKLTISSYLFARWHLFRTR